MMQPSEHGDASVLIRLFGHNTWADLTLLEFCEGLSAAQLDATAIGTYGSIRATLAHFIYSEVDYVNLATGKWPPVIPPEDRFEGFAVLKEGVRWAGDELRQLAIAARADTIVRVERPEEPVYEYPLASFLVQVLHHSAEHRAQIATILTQVGLEPPNLSGWQYMRERGELLEFEA
jgi:uncharacterized damage-inducible protein DinB